MEFSSIFLEGICLAKAFAFQCAEFIYADTRANVTSLWLARVKSQSRQFQLFRDPQAFNLFIMILSIYIRLSGLK